MSITSSNNQGTCLKNNEEAQVLRQIFDLIKLKKENNDIEKENISLLEKYKIKNIKLEKLDGIEECPKNRYKIKLQKILFNKKYEKSIK